MSVSRVFGLTGGIACGKSTVATYMAEMGAHIIDADQISRDVVLPDSQGPSCDSGSFYGERPER